MSPLGLWCDSVTTQSDIFMTEETKYLLLSFVTIFLFFETGSCVDHTDLKIAT